MAKKIMHITLMLALFSSLDLAHGTLVNQHMVREAYKLLKYYVGQDIYKMKDHIGYNEEGNGTYNSGSKLVLGAYPPLI